MKKYLNSFASLTTIISLLVPTIQPALGNVQDFDGFDDLAPYRGVTFLDGSYPSPVDFRAQKNKTAAGILLYGMKDGVPHILLGKRDDTQTYCNLGGKSDDEKNPLGLPGTLADTAARETSEESNGYYAFHPRTLNRAPYVDTLSEGLLYRMYVRNAEVVPEEHLNKALNESTAEGGKEYSEFRWVPASQVLEALESPVTLPDGESLSLYDPLADTLDTPTGRAYLQAIIRGHKISPLNKSLKPHINRLYPLDADDTASDTSWETVTEDHQAGDLRVHYPLPKITKEHLKYTPVPLGQDAFGRKDVLRILGKSYTLTPRNPLKERDQLAEAVAFHGAAMVELRSSEKIQARIKKLLQEPITEPTPPLNQETDSLWDPNFPLSPTEIHLSLILGPDFKTADDFPDESHPQTAADFANIRGFLNRSNEHYKRPFTASEQDVQNLVNVLTFERNHKKDPTFYHGAQSIYHGLWTAFTHLRELVDLEKYVGRTLVLRGSDLQFFVEDPKSETHEKRELSTIWNILDRFGMDHYEGRENLILFANHVLTANLDTTLVSSDSIEYWLNNHSAVGKHPGDFFSQALVLAGIMGDYNLFESIHRRHHEWLGGTDGNGVLLSINMPHRFLPTHTYGCRFLNPVTPTIYQDHPGKSTYKDTEGHHVPHTGEIYGGLQSEAQRWLLINPREKFDIEKDRKRGLLSEACMSLNPDFILHPEIKIKPHLRFPMTPASEQKMHRELQEVSTAMLADWLSSHQESMEHSYKNPRLRDLYKMIYKGTTGENFVEKPASFETIRFLLGGGHVGAVKKLLEKHPHLVEDCQQNPRDLVFAAAESNNSYALEYLLKDLIKTPLHEILTELDLLYTARTKEAVKALLTHYNVKHLQNTEIQKAAFDVLAHQLIDLIQNGGTIDAINLFMQNYFGNDTLLENSFLKRFYTLSTNPFISSYLVYANVFPTLTPLLTFEMYGDGKAAHLEALLNPEYPLHLMDPITDEPLLFTCLKDTLGSQVSPADTQKLALQFIKYHRLRNAQGERVFDLYQKAARNNWQHNTLGAAAPGIVYEALSKNPLYGNDRFWELAKKENFWGPVPTGPKKWEFARAKLEFKFYAQKAKNLWGYSPSDPQLDTLLKSEPEETHDQIKQDIARYQVINSLIQPIPVPKEKIQLAFKDADEFIALGPLYRMQTSHWGTEFKLPLSESLLEFFGEEYVKVGPFINLSTDEKSIELINRYPLLLSFGDSSYYLLAGEVSESTKMTVLRHNPLLLKQKVDPFMGVNDRLPILWGIFINDPAIRPFLKELCQQDPTLLDEKSLFGATFEYVLERVKELEWDKTVRAFNALRREVLGKVSPTN